MAKAGAPRKTPKKKTAAKKAAQPRRMTVGRAPDAARLQTILAALDRLYPNATCALHHRNAWELLVATILSAQCTDERVNMVTPQLFARFPTPEAMAKADVREVAEIIRSTGFFNNKAKNIVGAARKIVEEFGGEVPREMEKLLTVPGAARKTANVVLGTAYGIPSGVVVDTHVARISRRLELTNEKTPEKIEQDLMKILPRDRWILFSHQVIHFGRDICKARRPECFRCPLASICRAPDKILP
ncbi:MAG: endonuclease III [Bryobacteraceae bacterium]|nr:endonuclease III [Bryobacteraceae bacterium]